MCSSINLSTAEERVRKNWLYLSAFYFLFPALILVGFTAFLWLVNIQNSEWFESLKAILKDVLKFGLGWHCAYRKHGIKLLTLWLYFSPFIMVIQFGVLLWLSFDPWLVPLIAFDAGIYIWWYVLTYKMRKINLVIQERQSA